MRKRHIAALSKVDGIYRSQLLECCHQCAAKAHENTPENRVLADCFDEAGKLYGALHTPIASPLEFPSQVVFKQLPSVQQVVIKWKSDGVVSRRLLRFAMSSILEEISAFLAKRRHLAVKAIDASALEAILLHLRPRFPHLDAAELLSIETPMSLNNANGFLASVLEHPAVFFGPTASAHVYKVANYPDVFDNCSDGVSMVLFRPDAYRTALEVLANIPSPIIRSMNVSQLRTIGQRFICGCTPYSRMSWKELVCIHCSCAPLLESY